MIAAALGWCWKLLAQADGFLFQAHHEGCAFLTERQHHHYHADETRRDVRWG